MGRIFMIFCLAIFSTATTQGQQTLSKKEVKELSRVFEGELMVSEVTK